MQTILLQLIYEFLFSALTTILSAHLKQGNCLFQKNIHHAVGRDFKLSDYYFEHNFFKHQFNKT